MKGDVPVPVLEREEPSIEIVRIEPHDINISVNKPVSFKPQSFKGEREREIEELRRCLFLGLRNVTAVLCIRMALAAFKLVKCIMM